MHFAFSYNTELQEEFKAADKSGDVIDDVAQLSELITSAGREYFDPLPAELNVSYATYLIQS